MSKFVLPYEPQYTGHRAAEKQHKETQDQLRRRMRDQMRDVRETASPSIAPTSVGEDEKIK